MLKCFNMKGMKAEHKSTFTSQLLKPQSFVPWDQHAWCVNVPSFQLEEESMARPN